MGDSWLNYSAQTNRLFEVFVLLYVLGKANRLETHVVATMIAWREFLAVNACDFVVLSVGWIVDYAINA